LALLANGRHVRAPSDSDQTDAILSRPRLPFWAGSQLLDPSSLV
jgi:hypothetical protein